MTNTLTSLPRGEVIRGQPFYYTFDFEPTFETDFATGWTATAVFWPASGESFLTVTPTVSAAGQVTVDLTTTQTALFPDPGRPGWWPAARMEITLSGPLESARFIAEMMVSA